MSDRAPELGINPEIVCRVIEHAREFQAKEGVVIPEDLDVFSDDFDPMQILADHRNDLTFTELKAAIDDLEADQQITLVALMYLGRDDFELDEWQAALDEAKLGFSDHPTEYLLAHPHVADFLEAGLDKFGLSCNE